MNDNNENDNSTTSAAAQNSNANDAPVSSAFDVSGPFYTWRGTPGRDNPEAGRYYGKGMRIDHCLVHKTLQKQVSRVRVAGRGFSRDGFMGSDHSPLIMELTGEQSST